MTSADWTAVGTIALAMVTVALIITTILITKGDRRRADQNLKGEHQRELDREQKDREREQLAQAHLIQVSLAASIKGYRAAGVQTTYDTEFDSDNPRVAAIIINRSAFTITSIEARLCLGAGNSLTVTSFNGPKTLILASNIPHEVLVGMLPRHVDVANTDRLTPWDLGIRIESDILSAANACIAYPIVRWADRWGTKWEHNRGQVRRVTDTDDWTP